MTHSEHSELLFDISDGSLDLDSDRLVDDDLAASQDARARVSFLTGSAGTGKTYEIRRRLAENPLYGLLCATTGIAAINLGEGVVTINSCLRYFNSESLTDSYVSGRLIRTLRGIADSGFQNLVVDEVSMMSGEQLDVLLKALDDLEGQKGKKLGLVLTGDFCQLPPIKAKWAFEAECWPRFQVATEKLTKYWRQEDGAFLEALSAMRRGDGQAAADWLDRCGIEYATNDDLEFQGTTIKAGNDEVNRYNWACHQKVTGRMITSTATRWSCVRNSRGELVFPGEWRLIPDKLQVKEGAYVMILANQRREPGVGSFLYVNGDCGTVEGLSESGGIQVRLRRNSEVVTVNEIIRKNAQKEEPPALFRQDGDRRGYFDEEAKRWVIGEITYMPLRLAYATTVHKSQGLSLDAVQINLSNAFFGSPAMEYVAFSRCRTPQGLRVVGSREAVVSRCKVDPRVRRFL